MYVFSTTLDLDEAQMHVQSYMTQQCGYVLAHRDGNTLTFTKTKQPSALTFFILLFLFILPALLYLILAWGKQTCSAYFKKEKDGTKVTLEGISARPVIQRLAKFDPKLKELPEGKFSIFWDVSPVYEVAGGAVIFMGVILAMKGVGLI